MKVIFCAALAVGLLSSCKTETTAKVDGTDSLNSGEAIDYAYTIKHPADNWTPGDLKHVATVLKALKAYETGNAEECAKYFGDSAKLEFDGYEAKLSNDSLKKFFADGRSQYKEYNITMEDWESVISKDKKDEYVTLWYKQTWTDLKGKKDSAEMLNDLLMKDGKIVMLNEKSRRYAVKK